MTDPPAKPQDLPESVQAWFWEESWQTREREADTDFATGRVLRHSSSDEFLKALDQRMKPVDSRSDR